MKSFENPKPIKDSVEAKPAKETDFIIRPQSDRKTEKKERLSLLDLEKMEISNSFDEFVGEDRTIMEAFIHGKLSELSGGQKSQVAAIRENFWRKKRLCFDETAKKEYLEKKFTGQNLAENLKTADWQAELVEACRNNNEKEITKLRQKYETRFPGQLEGVEALMDINEFLETQKKIDLLFAKNKKIYREIGNLLKLTHSRDKNEALRAQVDIERLKKQRGENYDAIGKLTPIGAAYQTLLGDFVKNNVNNGAFLNIFWKVCREIGAAKNQLPDTERLRAGVLSQVAIFHSMEQLGYNPRMVHPDEDAFKKTDLQIEKEDSPVKLQIKGSAGERVLMDIEDKITKIESENDVTEMKVQENTDEVTLPTWAVECADGTVKYINDFLASEFSQFKVKMDELKKELEKEHKNSNIKAYMIVIPHASFDPVTGKPKPEFVAFLENYFGRNPKREDPAQTANPKNPA